LRKKRDAARRAKNKKGELAILEEMLPLSSTG